MKVKKSPRASLENKRHTRLFIGALFATAFTLVAFEWRTPIDLQTPRSPDGRTEIFETELIPIYRPKSEPPKPPKSTEIRDKIKLVDELQKTVTIETTPKEPPIIDHPTVIDIAPRPDTATERKVWGHSEVMPEFPGGESAMFAYLSEQLRYPPMARRAGIQGTVYTSFTVSADGTIEDIEVLRGLEGGCTEEALRVIRSMPRWAPGVQNGRKVNVHYMLPIRFTLK